MQYEHVEPLVSALLRPQHLDLVCPEQPVKSFVLDRAKSVQSELGLPFSDQQGRNRHVVLKWIKGIKIRVR